MGNAQAGWHPDPSGAHEQRYWDGAQWTDQVSDGGVASTDPLPGATDPTGEGAGPGRPKGLLVAGGIAVVAVVALAIILLTRGDDDGGAERAARVGEEVRDDDSARQGRDDDEPPADDPVDIDDLEDFDIDLGFDDDFDFGFGELGDLDELGTELLEQLFGMSVEQAECLERELTALDDAFGDQDELDPRAFSAVLDAFGSCGLAFEDLLTGGFSPPPGG